MEILCSQYNKAVVAVFLILGLISGSTAFTEVFSLAKDESDNVFSVGHTDGDFFINKIAKCEIQWTSSDGSTSADNDNDQNNEVFYDVKVRKKNGLVYAVGKTKGNSSGSIDEASTIDASLVVYNPDTGSAVQQMQYQIAEGQDDVASALTFNITSGDILVATNSIPTNDRSAGITEGHILTINGDTLEVSDDKELRIRFSVFEASPFIADLVYDETDGTLILAGRIIGEGSVWRYDIQTESVVVQRTWGSAFSSSFQISRLVGDGTGGYYVVGSTDMILNSTDLETYERRKYHTYVIKFEGYTLEQQWVRQIGASDGRQSGNDIKIDPSSGNIIILGTTDSSFTFDGFEVITESERAITDILRWEIDQESGVTLGIKVIESSEAVDKGNALEVLSDGTVVVGGSFNGGVNSAAACDQSTVVPDSHTPSAIPTVSSAISVSVTTEPSPIISPSSSTGADVPTLLTALPIISMLATTPFAMELNSLTSSPVGTITQFPRVSNVVAISSATVSPSPSDVSVIRITLPSASPSGMLKASPRISEASEVTEVPIIPELSEEAAVPSVIVPSVSMSPVVIETVGPSFLPQATGSPIMSTSVVAVASESGSAPLVNQNLSTSARPAKNDSAVVEEVSETAEASISLDISEVPKQSSTLPPSEGPVVGGSIGPVLEEESPSAIPDYTEVYEEVETIEPSVGFESFSSAAAPSISVTQSGSPMSPSPAVTLFILASVSPSLNAEGVPNMSSSETASPILPTMEEEEGPMESPEYTQEYAKFETAEPSIGISFSSPVATPSTSASQLFESMSPSSGGVESPSSSIEVTPSPTETTGAGDGPSYTQVYEELETVKPSIDMISISPIATPSISVSQLFISMSPSSSNAESPSISIEVTSSPTQTMVAGESPSYTQVYEEVETVEPSIDMVSISPIATPSISVSQLFTSMSPSSSNAESPSISIEVTSSPAETMVAGESPSYTQVYEEVETVEPSIDMISISPVATPSVSVSQLFMSVSPSSSNAESPSTFIEVTPSSMETVIAGESPSYTQIYEELETVEPSIGIVSMSPSATPSISVSQLFISMSPSSSNAESPSTSIEVTPSSMETVIRGESPSYTQVYEEAETVEPSIDMVSISSIATPSVSVSQLFTSMSPSSSNAELPSISIEVTPSPAETMVAGESPSYTQVYEELETAEPSTDMISISPIATPSVSVSQLFISMSPSSSNAELPSTSIEVTPSPAETVITGESPSYTQVYDEVETVEPSIDMVSISSIATPSISVSQLFISMSPSSSNAESPSTSIEVTPSPTETMVAGESPAHTHVYEEIETLEPSVETLLISPLVSFSLPASQSGASASPSLMNEGSPSVLSSETPSPTRTTVENEVPGESPEHTQEYKEVETAEPTTEKMSLSPAATPSGSVSQVAESVLPSTSASASSDASMEITSWPTESMPIDDGSPEYTQVYTDVETVEPSAYAVSSFPVPSSIVSEPLLSASPTPVRESGTFVSISATPSPINSLDSMVPSPSSSVGFLSLTERPKFTQEPYTTGVFATGVESSETEVPSSEMGPPESLDPSVTPLSSKTGEFSGSSTPLFETTDSLFTEEPVEPIEASQTEYPTFTKQFVGTMESLPTVEPSTMEMETIFISAGPFASEQASTTERFSATLQASVSMEFVETEEPLLSATATPMDLPSVSLEVSASVTPNPVMISPFLMTITPPTTLGASLEPSEDLDLSPSLSSASSTVTSSSQLSTSPELSNVGPTVVPSFALSPSLNDNLSFETVLPSGDDTTNTLTASVHTISEEPSINTPVFTLNGGGLIIENSLDPTPDNSNPEVATSSTEPSVEAGASLGIPSSGPTPSSSATQITSESGTELETSEMTLDPTPLDIGGIETGTFGPGNDVGSPEINFTSSVSQTPSSTVEGMVETEGPEENPSILPFLSVNPANTALLDDPKGLQTPEEALASGSLQMLPSFAATSSGSMIQSAEATLVPNLSQSPTQESIASVITVSEAPQIITNVPDFAFSESPDDDLGSESPEASMLVALSNVVPSITVTVGADDTELETPGMVSPTFSITSPGVNGGKESESPESTGTPRASLSKSPDAVNESSSSKTPTPTGTPTEESTDGPREVESAKPKLTAGSSPSSEEAAGPESSGVSSTPSSSEKEQTLEGSASPEEADEAVPSETFILSTGTALPEVSISIGPIGEIVSQSPEVFSAVSMSPTLLLSTPLITVPLDPDNEGEIQSPDLTNIPVTLVTPTSIETVGIPGPSTSETAVLSMTPVASPQASSETVGAGESTPYELVTPDVTEARVSPTVSVISSPTEPGRETPILSRTSEPPREPSAIPTNLDGEGETETPEVLVIPAVLTSPSSEVVSGSPIGVTETESPEVFIISTASTSPTLEVIRVSPGSVLEAESPEVAPVNPSNSVALNPTGGEGSGSDAPNESSTPVPSRTPRPVIISMGPGGQGEIESPEAVPSEASQNPSISVTDGAGTVIETQEGLITASVSKTPSPVASSIVPGGSVEGESPEVMDFPVSSESISANFGVNGPESALETPDPLLTLFVSKTPRPIIISMGPGGQSENETPEALFTTSALPSVTIVPSSNNGETTVESQKPTISPAVSKTQELEIISTSISPGGGSGVEIPGATISGGGGSEESIDETPEALITPSMSKMPEPVISGLENAASETESMENDTLVFVPSPSLSSTNSIIDEASPEPIFSPVASQMIQPTTDEPGTGNEDTLQTREAVPSIPLPSKSLVPNLISNVPDNGNEVESPEPSSLSATSVTAPSSSAGDDLSGEPGEPGLGGTSTPLASLSVSPINSDFNSEIVESAQVPTPSFLSETTPMISVSADSADPSAGGESLSSFGPSATAIITPEKTDFGDVEQNTPEEPTSTSGVLIITSIPPSEASDPVEPGSSNQFLPPDQSASVSPEKTGVDDVEQNSPGEPTSASGILIVASISPGEVSETIEPGSSNQFPPPDQGASVTPELSVGPLQSNFGVTTIPSPDNAFPSNSTVSMLPSSTELIGPIIAVSVQPGEPSPSASGFFGGNEDIPVRTETPEPVDEMVSEEPVPTIGQIDDGPDTSAPSLNGSSTCKTLVEEEPLDILDETNNFQRVDFIIQVAGPNLTSRCTFPPQIPALFVNLSAINTMSGQILWRLRGVADGPSVRNISSEVVSIEVPEDLSDALPSASPMESPSFSPQDESVEAFGDDEEILFNHSILFNMTAFLSPQSLKLAQGAFVTYIESQNIVKALKKHGEFRVQYTRLVKSPKVIDRKPEKRSLLVTDSASKPITAVAVCIALSLGVAIFISTTYLARQR